MQRHLGLHLSALKPTLEELHEAGLEAGDYFGDKDTNEADHNRRHNGGMRGWYDAITAVATSQTAQDRLRQHGGRGAYRKPRMQGAGPPR